MIASIEQAQVLFDQGQYLDAIKMCAKLLNNDPVPSKREQMLINILATKAFMSSGAISINDNESLNMILKTIQLACTNAESVEDLWEIEREIFDSFSDWKEKTYQEQLQNIVDNPSLGQATAYFSLPVDCAKVELHLSTPLLSSPLVDSYCAEKDINRETYGKTCRPTLHPRPSSKKIAALEHQTSLIIFNNAKNDLPTYPVSDIQYLQKTANSVLQRLAISEVLIKRTYQDSDLPISVRAERMKDHISIITYKLNARIFPNGNPMLLFCNNDTAKRNTEDKERNEIFQLLRELDPDYELPPICSAVQSTGGCYVATAVYGSYDCPEVWTLRRYRDNTLAKTWYGRAFIHTYYAISPTFVKWFGNTSWFKRLWKGKLDRMVKNLQAQGYDSTPYEDKRW